MNTTQQLPRTSQRSRWLPYILYVATVTTLGVAILTVAGRYWNDVETIALQILCWGLGFLVWLIVYLLADALTAVSLGATGGTAQFLVAAVLVFVGLSSLQYLLLRWLVGALRHLARRSPRKE